MSVAIWDFWAHGRWRIVVEDFNCRKYKVLKKTTTKKWEGEKKEESKRKKGKKSLPEGLTSLLNKNESWGSYRQCPGKYFMRTLGWIYCIFFLFTPSQTHLHLDVFSFKTFSVALKKKKRKNMWGYIFPSKHGMFWSKICGPGVSPKGPE